jgi:hypothetical protein
MVRLRQAMQFPIVMSNIVAGFSHQGTLTSGEFTLLSAHQLPNDSIHLHFSRPRR